MHHRDALGPTMLPPLPARVEREVACDAKDETHSPLVAEVTAEARTLDAYGFDTEIPGFAFELPAA